MGDVMDLTVICKWLLVFFAGGIIFTILGFIVTSIVGEVLLSKYIDKEESDASEDSTDKGDENHAD